MKIIDCKSIIELLEKIKNILETELLFNKKKFEK